MDGAPRKLQPSSASALKTGEEYKASLDDGRQIWVNGRKLANVFDEPALANCAPRWLPASI